MIVAVDERAGRSEVRLRGDWDAVVEEDEIALLADVLGDRPPPALVALVGLPRPVERVGIFDRDVHLQHVAAVDQAPALRDMQLIAVRRPVRINERPGVQTNGIDDQRIAFVMADRFSKP